jgi:hypothetical protein
MKEVKVTNELLDSEAKRLASEGLQRHEVILKLAKQYGSKEVARWLKLEAMLRSK